jgi:tetratricopeptide (TPR) repeat protein
VDDGATPFTDRVMVDLHVLFSGGAHGRRQPVGDTEAAMLLSTIVALAVTLAPPTPREAALIADAKDGALDTVDFTDAALIASGVPDAELPAARRAVTELLAPARAVALTLTDPQARAARLLEALHDGAFRQYRLEATTLPDLWRTGEYNCLSSSVAYLIAADGLLEGARAVLSVRHALVQVVVKGRAFDVQTTVRSGFGMPRRQMLSAEHLSRVARPGEDLAQVEREVLDAEEVPVLSLIAGLYANRAAFLMQQGRGAEADGLIDRATQLATGKSKERFASWRAALFNDTALALDRAGRHEEALHLLERIVDAAGQHRAVLRQNIGAFHVTLAQEAAKRGDWAESLRHAEAAQAAGLPSVAKLVGEAKGQLGAQRGGLDACATGGTSERVACLTALSSAKRAAGDATLAVAAARLALTLAPQHDGARFALYEAQAPRFEALVSARACDEAAALGVELERLVRGLSGTPWRAQDAIVFCFSAAGVDAFERGDFAAASARFRRALALDPRSASARKNLEASEHNIAVGLSNRGACDEARAVLGRSVPPARWREVLEPCWLNLTAELARAGDWTAMVTQARHGLLDVPGSEALTHNLVAALQRLAVAAAKAQRCDEATGLAAELRRLGDKSFADQLWAACAGR